MYMRPSLSRNAMSPVFSQPSFYNRMSVPASHFDTDAPKDTHSLRLLGSFSLPPVPFHDIRSPHPKLTPLPDSHFMAGIIHNHPLNVRIQLTNSWRIEIVSGIPSDCGTSNFGHARQVSIENLASSKRFSLSLPPSLSQLETTFSHHFVELDRTFSAKGCCTTPGSFDGR